MIREPGLWARAFNGESFRSRPNSGVLTSTRVAILSYIGVHAPCTVREVGDGVGLRSSSTVWNHIRLLSRVGLVDYQPSLSRTLCLHADVVVSEKGKVGWWARYPDANAEGAA